MGEVCLCKKSKETVVSLIVFFMCTHAQVNKNKKRNIHNPINSVVCMMVTQITNKIKTLIDKILYGKIYDVIVTKSIYIGLIHQLNIFS